MSKCQFGVTSIPYYLTEKSGSVAAMIDHGLNILCIARTWEPSNVNYANLFNDIVINWNTALDLHAILSTKNTMPNLLTNAANKFGDELNKY